MHHEGELRCDVSAAVDMDHRLSGTAYAKAPRGRAITIDLPTLQRHRSDVATGTGHTRPKHAGEAQKVKGAPSGAQALSRHTLDSPAFLTPTSGPSKMTDKTQGEASLTLDLIIVVP